MTKTLEKPTSLTSHAYKAVRDMVLAGEIEPGSKIKIDELRERLSFGASPIREALSLLSSEGLVERFEQRGFRAARVSVADFESLLQTRCWAEERALRESIACGDAAWEESIVLAEYRLANTNRSPEHAGNGQAWESLHQDFHKALISSCPSAYLLQFCDQLYDLNVRYRNIASLAAYPSRNVSNEHKSIAEATLNRDVEEAVALLVAHYKRTGGYLIKRLSKMAE